MKNTIRTVGVIGLGAMGKGLATSLRRAGHEPHVFDLRHEVATAFAAQGGTASPALAVLGAACDVVVSVVVSVVVNAAQSESLLFGSNSTWTRPSLVVRPRPPVAR